MTMVKTNLGALYESAHRVRTERASGITQTNVQKALEQIATQAPVLVPTAITAAMSPYAALSTDNVLYVDTAGGAVTILLPAAAQRNNRALVIKDSTGHANANNITITPNGAETIEGLLTLPINADFGGYELNPQAGVGYLVAP